MKEDKEIISAWLDDAIEYNEAESLETEQGGQTVLYCSTLPDDR